jgi:hypothetical protein
MADAFYPGGKPSLALGIAGFHGLKLLIPNPVAGAERGIRAADGRARIHEPPGLARRVNFWEPLPNDAAEVLAGPGAKSVRHRLHEHLTVSLDNNPALPDLAVALDFEVGHESGECLPGHLRAQGIRDQQARVRFRPRVSREREQQEARQESTAENHGCVLLLSEPRYHVVIPQ